MGDKWTFKKEVSIGDLVAIAFAIAGVFSAYFTLKGQIDVLRTQVIAGQHNTDTLKYSIDNRLNRIEDKLDRLVERK